MIRDPSDGSVKPALSENNEFNPQREYPDSYGRVIDTSTSGLPITKAKADYLARLEESRKWLKTYVRPTING